MKSKTTSPAEAALTTITATNLRTDLRQYLEVAHYQGQRFLIERNHVPCAVILGIEDYRRLIGAGDRK